MPRETPGEHLLRSIRVTAGARFNASRRLRRHENFSLWSISFSSLLLIVLPLLRIFDIELRYTGEIISLFGVIAAAAILIVSILLNGTKFGERAAAMHRCALELNPLSREVELLVHTGEDDKEKIRELYKKYDEILSRYENHSDIDYRVAQVNKHADFYRVRWWNRKLITLETWAEFTPYIVLIVFECVFLYMLVS